MSPVASVTTTIRTCAVAAARRYVITAPYGVLVPWNSHVPATGPRPAITVLETPSRREEIRVLRDDFVVICSSAAMSTIQMPRPCVAAMSS